MADEEPRWAFSKFGLGYRVEAKELDTEIRFTHVKRRSGSIVGDIAIRCNIEGVKTVIDGVMHAAKFDASSSSARSTLAKKLEERTPDAAKKLDWFDGLESLCQHVMISESEGQPYHDLGNEPPEEGPAKYILDPLAPSNVSALLYGPGGSGKSIIALAGAMSIQNGREIIPGIAPATKGNVLYLDWETDAPVINYRIHSIAAGAGFKPSNITYRRCIRPLAEEAEDIANQVALKEIVFMVIDSAGMAMGVAGEYGDSNESTLRMFDAIRHINVSTQIVDHVSKQEIRTKGKAGLLPYGSVYKMNLARSAWEVRNGTTQDDEFARVTLIHTKANDSRLLPKIGLGIDWQPGAITFSSIDVDEDEGSTQTGDNTSDAIREWLEDKPMSSSELTLVLTGINPATVRSNLSRMVQRGTLYLADGVYSIAPKKSGPPKLRSL